ncbi:unnamed protein product [Colias eurytheme]|nr:unnamed protein product [Colias eurytheme]
MTVAPQLPVQTSGAADDDGVRPGPTKQLLTYPVATISPVPQGQFIRGQGKRKNKPVKEDWFLTSSPNMQEIIAKNRPKDPPAEKKRQVKRKICNEDEINISASKNAQRKESGKKLRASRQRRTAPKYYDSSGSEDFSCEANDDDSDCACIYCNDLFSNSKPGEDPT